MMRATSGHDYVPMRPGHNPGQQGRADSKERASQRQQLIETSPSEVAESEVSMDEGEFLFADSAEEIARVSTIRNKMLSQSSSCRSLVSFVVFLNTVVIAGEAMFIDDKWVIWDALEFCFTVFYVVEISFRLYEVGLMNFLTQLDWAWNAFDMAITILSVVDTVTSMTTGSASGASVGRLFRIFRILRMFRAMRFMHEVDYVLSTAAKATMKLSVIVTLVIFVAAIIATNMLWDSNDEVVSSMFANLGLSMWSLFKLMTLDDWVPLSERVIAEKPGMAVFFVVFIFSTSIALISLVPAIFIEISLSSRAREDRFRAEKEKDSLRKKKSRLLRTLFKMTDLDNNGNVSIAEMKKVLTDQVSLRHLQDAGLTRAGELRDVRLGLFDLWEEQLEETNNAQSEISEEDFISGLLRHVTEVSMTTLWRNSTATRLMLRDFASAVRKDLKDIQSCQRHLMSLHEARGLDRALLAIHESVEAARDDLAKLNHTPEMEALEENVRDKDSGSGSSSGGAGFGIKQRLSNALLQKNPKSSPGKNHRRSKSETPNEAIVHETRHQRSRSAPSEEEDNMSASLRSGFRDSTTSKYSVMMPSLFEESFTLNRTSSHTNVSAGPPEIRSNPRAIISI